MESQHRFPQSLENARAFSHISTARLRLHSLSKKGIIVDREREKCLTLITLATRKETSESASISQVRKAKHRGRRAHSLSPVQWRAPSESSWSHECNIIQSVAFRGPSISGRAIRPKTGRPVSLALDSLGQTIALVSAC